jgi:hypothetical protein
VVLRFCNERGDYAGRMQRSVSVGSKCNFRLFTFAKIGAKKWVDFKSRVYATLAGCHDNASMSKISTS